MNTDEHCKSEKAKQTSRYAFEARGKPFAAVVYGITSRTESMKNAYARVARSKRKVPPAYSRADESARSSHGRRDDDGLSVMILDLTNGENCAKII